MQVKKKKKKLASFMPINKNNYNPNLHFSKFKEIFFVGHII